MAKLQFAGHRIKTGAGQATVLRTCRWVAANEEVLPHFIERPRFGFLLRSGLLIEQRRPADSLPLEVKIYLDMVGDHDDRPVLVRKGLRGRCFYIARLFQAYALRTHCFGDPGKIRILEFHPKGNQARLLLLDELRYCSVTWIRMISAP
jgi:hypothetical protein